MPVAAESPSETQAVLKPAGNRARVLEKKRKDKLVKIKTSNKVIITDIPAPIARDDDSTCSSECSSGNGSTVKVAANSKHRVKGSDKPKTTKSKNVVEKGGSLGIYPSVAPETVKRCDWITPNSDPLYTSFHNEEWGVPVRDDTKLFELLVLSMALAEFTWLTILNKRRVFRKVFNNFDPLCITKFAEKLMVNRRKLLSEPKLLAVVENANQMMKIQQEFGSFSEYIWSFVNHKPIRNEFRYGRQVPIKTPKAELMSKELMNRGFRCVGPSVVYSFMQVAGLVNDHLITCFRYQECNNILINGKKLKINEIEGTN